MSWRDTQSAWTLEAPATQLSASRKRHWICKRHMERRRARRRASLQRKRVNAWKEEALSTLTSTTPLGTRDPKVMPAPHAATASQCVVEYARRSSADQRPCAYSPVAGHTNPQPRPDASLHTSTTLEGG